MGFYTKHHYCKTDVPKEVERNIWDKGNESRGKIESTTNANCFNHDAMNTT
jgi:hypothetical protein